MFLANENFPKPAVLLLRENGYVVFSIQEETPGVSDLFVLQRATEESLIILTFDSDYGEMIFRHGTKNPPAIIYFRDKGAEPLFAGHILLALLQEGQVQFNNAFSVIERNNIRQRFYK